MISWQSLIKSRLVTFALTVVLIFVMMFAAKIVLQKYQIDREISKLQNQVEKIKKDNSQLGFLTQYFNTPDYQEKAAREKLNLKKEGEFVVGLPAPDEAVAGAQIQAGSSSNFKKWFNYFFTRTSGQ